MPWGFPRQTVVMEAGARAINEDKSPVPDIYKRQLMNLILVGGGLVPTIGILGGSFLYYFYPASSGGGGGALKALDRNGDPVTLT